MKKVIFIALCGLLSAGAHAQVAKRALTATPATAATAVEKDKKPAEWPQLDAFHKVMAQTYHPAEKGDFKPIRKRSGELVDVMKALIGTPFPEAYRTAEMKTLLANLEGRVATVHKLVEAKAGNDELMKALTEAHDVFHKVAGLCNEGGEHHDH